MEFTSTTSIKTETSAYSILLKISLPNIGCPAIHNSVTQSEFFKGVVIYNIFNIVNTMFLLVQKLFNM
jgi:hypothetical protein